MAELSPRAKIIQAVTGLLAIITVIVVLVIRPEIAEQKLSELDRIVNSGELRVLTLNSATTYFQDIDQLNGFEYHLASLFAEHIGVKAKFIIVSTYSELYPELLFGSGDLIAAGLSADESKFSSAVEYGPPYYEVTNQLIYKKDAAIRPENIGDLVDGNLTVISGTRHIKSLGALQESYPNLVWLEDDDMAPEELIEQVELEKIEYAVISSQEFALQRRFFPELKIAFEVGQPQQLRWAINHFEDKSLSNAVTSFIQSIKQNGELEKLIHRHYSHVDNFNYSDIQTFTRNIEKRLPKYRAMFETEAQTQGLDWRLLAAIGYQESLWNPKAKSPTGVRGMMMLTRITSKQMGISNRLDAEQSIHGGAKYFANILERIPERIPFPDRTWFALAAYNVGFGHMEDARKITQKRGGNPDHWIDVKQSLPLLARKKWYKQTRYGYARGWEPVKYVENIRQYYDYLVGLDERDKRLVKPEPVPAEDVKLSPSF